jgi:hypothetical protein
VSALLSTLQRLPDDARAEAERALLPIARDAALGALAGDVAHDVGNALFGLVGLVDLSLDGTPVDTERTALIAKAQEDVKDAFRPLLAYTRGAGDVAPGDLAAAATAALALYRHGMRKQRDVDARGLEGCARVRCPRGLLEQAVLHVLLSTNEQAPLVLDVAEGELAASPAADESLHTVAARRIALDHGGGLDRDGARLVLRLPTERP